MGYEIVREAIMLNAAGGCALGRTVVGLHMQADEVLTGIMGFDMSYAPGTDHHVRTIRLDVNAELVGDRREAVINVRAELTDDSNHFIDNANLYVCLIAVSKGDVQKKVKVNALQGFEMTYGGDDHHMREIMVSEKQTYMADDSGHKSAGRASYRKLEISEEAAKEIRNKCGRIIGEFFMSMGNDDHHIMQISISGEKGVEHYTLEDKHKNRIDRSRCRLKEGIC